MSHTLQNHYKCPLNNDPKDSTQTVRYSDWCHTDGCQSTPECLLAARLTTVSIQPKYSVWHM